MNKAVAIQRGEPTAGPPAALPAICCVALASAAVISHADVVADLVEIWNKSQDFSHGYVVPIFSIYLIWRQRAAIAECLKKPTSLFGLIAGVNCGVVAIALRISGVVYQVVGLEAIGLMVALYAVALICLGRRGAWLVTPAIGFLIFALPMPGFIIVPLRLWLQKLATIGSTFVLQTLGLPAVIQGNTIRLPDAVLGVAEACSGMRMLITFAAIVCGSVLVSRQPLYEKALTLLAIVPITLGVNIARIVTTGIVYNTYGEEQGDAVHDWAGFGMILLGVGLLSVWTGTISKIFDSPGDPAAGPRDPATAATT
ncbi:MAG: exosortase/archaeosortase family protein [Planctomycetota bacterium]